MVSLVMFLVGGDGGDDLSSGDDLTIWWVVGGGLMEWSCFLVFLSEVLLGSLWMMDAASL